MTKESKKEKKENIEGGPLSKKEQFKDLIATINKNIGGDRPVLQWADESSNPFMLRRPFGIASLDIAIGGGMPAGGMTQIGSIDGIGKNSLANRAVAQNQYIYGDDSRIMWVCLEVPYDKKHARINGVIVPSSDIDLDLENMERDSRNVPSLTVDEIQQRKISVGEFLICDSGSAENRLQAIIDAVAANAFQLIVVDSIAAVVSKYRVETPLEEEPRQAATAWLLSEFQRMCWNKFSCTDDGSMNTTSIILINQARSKQNSKRSAFQRDWQVSGAYAIRHGKLLDIILTRGELIESGSKKIGKEVGWEIAKGKAGCHEGGKGSLIYNYKDGFDRASDLVKIAKIYGVLVQEGKTYNVVVPRTGEVIEEKIVGGTGSINIIERARSDHEFFDILYYASLEAADVSCLHRLDND